MQAMHLYTSVARHKLLVMVESGGMLTSNKYAARACRSLSMPSTQAARHGMHVHVHRHNQEAAMNHHQVL